MRYLFSLGSNSGNRRYYIKKAVDFLKTLGEIQAVSSLYETSPVGMPSKTRSFFNRALMLESNSHPEAMLQWIKEFETSSGRAANSHMKPRTIDIDILFIDNRVIDLPGLRVPHPECAGRRFVLEPLAEIAPGLVHPGSGMTIVEILESLNSDETVRKLPGKNRAFKKRSAGGPPPARSEDFQ